MNAVADFIGGRNNMDLLEKHRDAWEKALPLMDGSADEKIEAEKLADEARDALEQALDVRPDQVSLDGVIALLEFAKNEDDGECNIGFDGVRAVQLALDALKAIRKRESAWRDLVDEVDRGGAGRVAALGQ